MKANLKPIVWIKPKAAFVAGAVVLLIIGVVVIATVSPSGGVRWGRLKLPVGQGTPAISIGQVHGLILASDGSLWSWGTDFLGWPVLGLGTVANQVQLRRIGGDTNWVGVSAGWAHNVAVKSDGTLWAWGENLSGQLGVGTAGRQNPMANVPVPSAPGQDWKEAVAGGCFTVALKKDGTLWAWGNNWAGPLGTGSTSNSLVPVRVGASTNWTKVWAGILETVAMQSDGSLWYWGENLNPAFAQGTNQVLVPTRVSPDTNWVDVGFGVNTIFATKSDGTLWAWGRNAEAYTGAPDQTRNVIPTRVGTNTDWRTVPACGGWWCQGLTKKDGSFWFMDASDGESNGPRAPYKPPQFRRIALQKHVVAFTAGAAHGAAAGFHAPIGVAVTRDGEVWTWGMTLGEPPSFRGRLQALISRIAGRFNLRIPWPAPNPIIREEPWQLRNVEAGNASKSATAK